jgi:hypothetical protein
MASKDKRKDKRLLLQALKATALGEVTALKETPAKFPIQQTVAP